MPPETAGHPAPVHTPRPALTLLTHVVLVLACLTTLVPFGWMLLTSVKSFGEATTVPPRVLPATWLWSNYPAVLDALPFASFYFNSAVSTALRTAGVLLFASMCAYAFARLRFPFKNALFVAVLSVMMIPPQTLIIPQYQIIAELGWLNSIKALVAPGLFSGFVTFLLRQFFASIPNELEEAARLDGAGPIRIYALVMMPLALPGLIAAGVLKTLDGWNELFWPLVVNSSPDKLTLPAGLAFMNAENFTDFPLQMAGGTMSVLPMLVMFVVLQRYVIRGMNISSGLK